MFSVLWSNPRLCKDKSRVWAILSRGWVNKETIILPSVSWECTSSSFSLREGHRKRITGDRFLMKIFRYKWEEVTGGWREMHDKVTGGACNRHACGRNNKCVQHFSPKIWKKKCCEILTWVGGVHEGSLCECGHLQWPWPRWHMPYVASWSVFSN
jgi:hypothetical protein